MVPHKVMALYSSLHTTVHGRAEGWGQQQAAFPSDGISRAWASCTGHNRKQGAVRALRTRERTVGAKAGWTGVYSYIRCSRNAGGSVPSPGRESKLLQRANGDEQQLCLDLEPSL